jgi:arylsulfatase A-like enzyme
MLTGHYPSKHGCYTIGTSLPCGYQTLPQILSDNGYFTALIGKAHFQAYHTEGSFEAEPNIFDYDFLDGWKGPYYGFEHVKLSAVHSTEKNATGLHYGLWLKEKGVDTDLYFGNTEYADFGRWDLPEEYSNSSWVAEESIEAIKKSQKQNKPFYLWASFQDPHNSCFVPEPWASMYDRDDMPVYDRKEGEHVNKPPFYDSMAETGNYGDDKELCVKNWHCISNLPFMDEEKKKEIMGLYYGMVSQMDYNIGRIRDYLEKEELIDDTLIVFTSDHGDYMGNHGM